MSAFIAPVIGHLIDRIGRNITFVFFAVIITLLLWALSTATLAIAVDHTLVRPREVAPPTVGFVVAMLFAL